jgi:YHS domain-containing protein
MSTMKKLNTVLAVATFGASLSSFAADIDMNADANDVAIKGYDPVAYFTVAQPKKGSPRYSATYKNAIYHFVSEGNRNMFRDNPAAYAPQYGGFCAFGVSVEKKLDTDPTAWKIVDNKLYLNLNKDVQKRWLTDAPGYIDTANDVWRDIKSVAASEL